MNVNHFACESMNLSIYNQYGGFVAVWHLLECSTKFALLEKTEQIYREITNDCDISGVETPFGIAVVIRALLMVISEIFSHFSTFLTWCFSL